MVTWPAPASATGASSAAMSSVTSVSAILEVAVGMVCGIAGRYLAGVGDGARGGHSQRTDYRAVRHTDLEVVLPLAYGAFHQSICRPAEIGLGGPAAAQQRFG